jgi:radical SAM protein with 4Fe4S-binding SPASM domain
MRLVTENTCSCPWDWVVITADGTVRPCCYGVDNAGNLNEQSLEEIWNGRTMLELRYFIEHNQLHPMCRHASCRYAQAKEGAKARPHEVKDCRYAFADVAVRRHEENLEVEGRVVNCGETAWFLFDDAGNLSIQIGARVIDAASGTTHQQLLCPIQGQALFPGESASFEFRVPRNAGAELKLDVCSNQGEFWFEERGEKPMVIPL